METTERNSMFKRKQEPELLMDPIQRVLIEMEAHEPDGEEYHRCLDRLERLVRLKKEEKSQIDPNTLLTVGGNVLIALGIVAYEQKHVWGSKAAGMFLRPRG
jgi:hypothetical protein